MLIGLECGFPFYLAHGGAQIQIAQTKQALEKMGVNVEFMRWWDDRQKPDVIHYFGVPPSSDYQVLAKQKGIALVNTVLLTETCNRSRNKLLAQAAVTRATLAIPFLRMITNQLSWQAYRRSECIIVGLEAEKNVLRLLYGIPGTRIRLVPIGCEAGFISASPSPRTGDYLACVGTITERKRTVELAEMAIAAQIPVLFVGKPYDEADAYWRRFREIRNANPHWVRHQYHLEDRQTLITLLQNARGFVLFSRYENWCMAADEAMACGLPLLLPDQKWARERFGSAVSYLAEGDVAGNPARLRRFFEECPRLPTPPKPVSWDEVGRKLLGIYEEQLAHARDRVFDSRISR